MDFLDRLRMLMESHSDNNASLAKKSGIPYTTIDGIFKRGWEKAQITTIQRICNYYSVSLDYMVYGADRLSQEAIMMAAKYDEMTPYGKSIIATVIENEAKYGRAIRIISNREEERAEAFKRYTAEEYE